MVMDIVKPYSRRSFIVIIVFMVFLAAAVAAAVYFGKTSLSQGLSRMATPDVSPEALVSQVIRQLDTYAVYLASIFGGAAILCGIVLWLILKRVAKGVLSSPVASKSRAKKRIATPAEKRDDSQVLRNQRLFLHLLGVLQREGRFVDFLQEEIELYEDDQIGAAVRNIHSSCRKVIRKTLPVKPIAEGDEGEAITVEKGFDPDAIKLTGRVTGEPPFKGVIRHKGWRAQKLDLPDLSAIKDPTIIAPAEVEIQ
jgi:flagellar basal body-associated protein FliL